MSLNESMPFEKALQRLESVVSKIESPDVALEEALLLFEEGIKLSRYCEQKLGEAQAKMQTLIEGQEAESIAKKDD
jgi:exodeoxyribonuclease VII small subunit